MAIVLQKLCIICKVLRDVAFFSKDKAKADGLRNECKDCSQANKAKYPPTNIKNKECYVCKKTLPIANFNKNCRVKDGYMRNCKDCRRILDNNRKQKKINDNPQPLVDSKLCIGCLHVKPSSEFRINSKSNDNLTSKCIDCLPKSTWTVEKQRESYKKYYKKNLEKLRLKWKKAGEFINRRIRDSLNHRISDALFASKMRKDNTTLFYTGCKIDFLKKWIESQFKEGMSWDNYGEWELDHVKPCCAYDLSIIEQQYKCFNWRNLRPLWKDDNMSKSGSIDYGLIKRHRKMAYEFELNFSAQDKECELLEQP